MRQADAHRNPDELFADDGAPKLYRVKWIWVVYGALFGLSIPWYVPANSQMRIWLGLPHWVVLSLAAVLAAGVFTLIVVRLHWPDDELGESAVGAKPIR